LHLSHKTTLHLINFLTMSGLDLFNLLLKPRFKFLLLLVQTLLHTLFPILAVILELTQHLLRFLLKIASLFDS